MKAGKQTSSIVLVMFYTNSQYFIVIPYNIHMISTEENEIGIGQQSHRCCDTLDFGWACLYLDRSQLGTMI